MAEQGPTVKRMLRVTMAATGAIAFGAVWAGSAAARRTFHLVSISVVLGVVTLVGVSRATAKTTAVCLGTLVSNYVANGVIPGALMAMVVYDGWCIASWAYNRFYSDPE